jgi:hypothetical protein
VILWEDLPAGNPACETQEEIKTFQYND